MAGGLKSFETYTDEDWHSVFDGLTLSAVRTIRAALPYLRRAEWARIVNVSAMSTKRQSPPLIAYTAAKSALTSLTKNLAQTLAPDGILVNTVSPGTFASASLKAALAGMPGVDENDLHDIMRFIGEGFGHHVFLDRAAETRRHRDQSRFINAFRRLGRGVGDERGGDWRLVDMAERFTIRAHWARRRYGRAARIRADGAEGQPVEDAVPVLVGVGLEALESHRPWVRRR